MPSNPQLDAAKKDIFLRLRYLQVRFPELEEEDEEEKDKGTLKSSLCDSKTTVHDSSDVQNDMGFIDEWFNASAEENARLYVKQDREELHETISNVDNESTAQSDDDGLIFSGAEVDQIGECFQYVISKCDENSSSAKKQLNCQ